MSTTEEPCVIVKDSFAFDNIDGQMTPIPEWLILGNEAGLRWLAKFFEKCADETAQLTDRSQESALAEHWHIKVEWEPVAFDLSDHVELRVVPFHSDNRAAILSRYRIETSSARHDSIVDRSEDTIARVKTEIANL